MKKATTKNAAVRAVKTSTHPGSDFFVEFWEESWTYVKTAVDVQREPVIILNKNLKVLAANEAFYTLFQVRPADTEGTLVYELGNGQWDIPALRKLLEDILPKETSFKSFEVEHVFPHIGRKTILLNARHIYTQDPANAELFPPIIMLTLEDITGLMTIATTFTKHTNTLEQALTLRTAELQQKITGLEKKLSVLSSKL